MPGQDLTEILGVKAEVVGSSGISKLVADTAAGVIQAGVQASIPELATAQGLCARFAVAECGLQARGAQVYPAGQDMPAPALAATAAEPALRVKGLDT
jgi:hypothetical protein